ncbi:MAG TPA: FTR1 family protein [Burkholderiales bacterium]|nr:FTR1 family protein [Burkholderiales bacterium]
MLQMLVVTSREGIEAFLIVAITIAYLKKTGRDALLPAAHWGAGVAVVLSLVLGVFLAEFAVLPIYEAILAAVAAVLVISMVVYMLKHAKKLRGEIGARIDSAAAAPGTGASVGVFLLVLLMITREGMEMAFIAASLARQTEAASLLSGAVIGIALAALVAWAWSRYGHRVNLGLFFQVTSIFLILFALQLLIYAFHEATEANVLPVDNAYWHIATEPYGPEGEYGAILSYALVALPGLWLAWSMFNRTPTVMRAGTDPQLKS